MSLLTTPPLRCGWQVSTGRKAPLRRLCSAHEDILARLSATTPPTIRLSRAVPAASSASRADHRPQPRRRPRMIARLQPTMRRSRAGNVKVVSQAASLGSERHSESSMRASVRRSPGARLMACSRASRRGRRAGFALGHHDRYSLRPGVSPEWLAPLTAVTRPAGRGRPGSGPLPRRRRPNTSSSYPLVSGELTVSARFQERQGW